MNLGETGVVVAARTASARLPEKALLPFHAGVPMILFLLRRLRPLASARVVLATTTLASDDRLTALVEADGFPVFRGADADVVARYVGAADRFGFDTVARVTGDCPFVDAELVDWCIRRASEFDRFDLATTKGRFPVGLDVEIYAARRLAALHAAGALSLAQREHVTLYFYDHDGDCVLRRIEPRADWRFAGRPFTVDTREDYDTARGLAARFATPNFPVQAMLASMVVGGTS